MLSLIGDFSSFTGTINLTNTSPATGTSYVELAPNNTPALTANGLRNSTLNVTNNTELMFKTNSGGNNITAGALTGDSTSFLAGGDNSGGGNGTLTTGTLNSNTTFAGQILDLVIGNTTNGHLSIVKAGTGTLVLTNSNMIYAGITNIIGGGTLQIDGVKSGGGNVTANTGTLSGIGTVGGTVTIQAGAHLAPGTKTSVGTITLSKALTLAIGSNLDVEFRTNSDSTITNDLVNVTGTNGLTINGGNVNPFNEGTTTAFTTDGTYNLIQYVGTLTGLASSLTVGNQQAGKTYSFNTFSGFVTLSISSGGTATFWNKATGDTWGSAANWTAGGPPDAVGANAAFGGGGTALSGPATVTLDGTRTAGTLSFNSTPSFTISQGTGNGILNLDGGTNAGTVTVSNGSHAITAPIGISTLGATVFVVNAADTITFGGALSGLGGVSGGGPITKLGAGSLAINSANPLYTAAVTTSGGTVFVINASALQAGAIVAAGGAVSLAGGICTFNLARFGGGSMGAQ